MLFSRATSHVELKAIQVSHCYLRLIFQCLPFVITVDYIYISNSLFSSVRSCSMLDCLIIFRWSTASWTKLLCFCFKRTDFNSRRFPRRWKRSHHFIVRAHGSHRIYWLWQVRCTCSKALSSVVTSYNMRPRDIPTKCCVLLLLAFFSP